MPHQCDEHEGNRCPRNNPQECQRRRRICKPHVCKGLGDSTIRQIHQILSGALDRAVAWGRIAVNPAGTEGFVPARSSLAFLTRSGRGARTVRFVDGTNRDGSLVVRQLGWVPVTVTSARLITPALVAGDCTLT